MSPGASRGGAIRGGAIRGAPKWGAVIVLGRKIYKHCVSSVVVRMDMEGQITCIEKCTF